VDQGVSVGTGDETPLIAIDTDVLVYAFNRDEPQHGAAWALVSGLAEGPRPWGVPWPCTLEFLHTVTASRYARPASVALAFEFLGRLKASPSFRSLLPTEDTGRVLRDVLDESRVRGADVHDAHIFALCLEHGVRELLTTDKGFRRFRGLKVRDPFQ